MQYPYRYLSAAEVAFLRVHVFGQITANHGMSPDCCFENALVGDAADCSGHACRTSQRTQADKNGHIEYAQIALAWRELGSLKGLTPNQDTLIYFADYAKYLYFYT